MIITKVCYTKAMINIILVPLTTTIHPHRFSKAIVDAYCKHQGLNCTLAYDQMRPFLSNGTHISIAHKGEVLVFAIAPHPLGVDIELTTLPSKNLIQTYALSPFHPIKDWCMKEAYFKMTQDRQYEKVMLPKLPYPTIEINYSPYYILVLASLHDDVKVERFDGTTLTPLPF